MVCTLPWFVGSEFSDLQNSVGEDDIRATTPIICDIVQVAAAETPNTAEKIGLAGLEELSAFGGGGGACGCEYPVFLLLYSRKE
ncbi:uncharacterized protein RSE6_12203 [Rhynchosporium secalis]|uniref:Uncharacterized protein n=1 Tax=Rhynchosporium secalis TaxID=38038 RepID=A0A1E1MPT7_RHYSE|nr:uncharacterized protein RSE6_12203 [Rhynchosporium secalis]